MRFPSSRAVSLRALSWQAVLAAFVVSAAFAPQAVAQVAPGTDSPPAGAAEHVSGPDLSTAVRSEARRYLADAVSLGTAPLHWTKGEWARFAAAAGIVAALAMQDERISAEFERGRSARTDAVANVVTPFGAWIPVGLSAGILGSGLLLGNVSLRETGRDAIEAEILAAGIVTPVLKEVSGRSRPNQGEGDGDEFRPFSSGRSFPSGHATEAFAFASVIAAHYRGWVVPTLAYALASGAALARVHSRAHFASDVVAGAVLGTVIGRAVVHRHTDREESTAWSLAPIATDRGLGVGVSVALGGK